MKEFIVKESEGFRLRVKKSPCLRPDGLFSLDFVQEVLTDGQVSSTSTYNFFLDENELRVLAEGLVK